MAEQTECVHYFTRYGDGYRCTHPDCEEYRDRHGRSVDAESLEQHIVRGEN